MNDLAREEERDETRGKETETRGDLNYDTREILQINVWISSLDIARRPDEDRTKGNDARCKDSLGREDKPRSKRGKTRKTVLNWFACGVERY